MRKSLPKGKLVFQTVNPAPCLLPTLIWGEALDSALGHNGPWPYAVGTVPGSHPRVWYLSALPDRANGLNWTRKDRYLGGYQRWGWGPGPQELVTL